MVIRTNVRLVAVCAGALLSSSACTALLGGIDQSDATASTGTGGGSSSSISTGPGGGGGGQGGGPSAGGAGGTGGDGGGGGSGGQAGSGGTPNPCPGQLFCDDFEAYPAGSPPPGLWTNNQIGGHVAVDGARHRSGTKAVKMTADGSTAYRSVMISLADASLFPVAGNAFYGRMMFYLESTPNQDITFTLVDGIGLAPGQSYHVNYRYGGRHAIFNGSTFVGSQVQALYDTPDSYGSPPVGPATDCWRDADGKVIPVGAWTCAEWQFDGPNNTMRLWFDGQPVSDATVVGTGDTCLNQDSSYVWTAPTFTRLDVGWESYQPDDPRTIWIDDFAIGSQRIGCP